MDHESGFKRFLNIGSSPLLKRRGIFLRFGHVSYVTYSQQVALLRVLAIASEKQLSLIDVLETFAKDVRGRWRYQILRLVDLLRSGVSLADAIEKIPTVIPAHAYFLVRAGAESGTLPSALALAVETCADRRNERDFMRSGFLLYLGLILTLSALILSFICYWIIPKLKKIYLDFGMDLPELTWEVMKVSDWLVEYFYLFPVLGFGVLLLRNILIKLGILERNGYGKSFSGIYPRGRAPDVLRFLHVVTESGRPLLGAFETLTHMKTNRFMTQRFQAILEEIRRGNDCWTALHDYSLLAPSEVRLLQSAQRAGNLSWALKAVAKSIERRIDYRTALLREYLEPAMILGIGCVVGAFVVGLFLPLVSLMNSLA